MNFRVQQQKRASRGRQGASPATLRKQLILQNGLCALSGVEMTFDPKEGTPERDGKGCHPLYPAVDHIDPGNPSGGHQIICYALNDLKGHMPTECFNALKETRAWIDLMDRWRKQAEIDRTDRDAFHKLIRPNAVKKNRVE